MKWLIKDLAKINIQTQKQLAAATPNWSQYEDWMRLSAQRAAKGKTKPGQHIAIALFVDEALVGWAMCDFMLSKNSKKVRTYVYVKRLHRRNGYGTFILKKAREVAKRRGKGIRVCPHDTCSKKFFQSVNISSTEIAPGYTLSS